MSRYTTELRFLANWSDEQIGLSSYPIFDESYRSSLNKKIRTAFMFDEIGFETPARFANRLSFQMDKIMPYYNQLYKSALETINPFLTMNYDIMGNESLIDILNQLKNNINDKNVKTNTEHESFSTDNSNDTKNENQNETNESTSFKNGVSSSLNVKENSGNNSTYKSDVHLENNGENESYSDKTDDTITFGKTTDRETIGDNTDVRTYQDETTTNNSPTKKQHSFTVNSDTPEGFVLTDTIGDDTYANTATKVRTQEDSYEEKNIISGGHTDKHVSHTKDTDSGNEKTVNSKNGSKNKIVNSDYSNISNETNSSSGNENITDTKNESENGVQNDIRQNGIKSNSTHNAINSITENGSSNDIIKDIVNEILSENKNSERKSKEHYEGFNGKTMSQMLTEWRNTFLNIDAMILKDLDILFMQVLN